MYCDRKLQFGLNIDPLLLIVPQQKDYFSLVFLLNPKPFNILVFYKTLLLVISSLRTAMILKNQSFKSRLDKIFTKITLHLGNYEGLRSLNVSCNSRFQKKLRSKGLKSYVCEACSSSSFLYKQVCGTICRIPFSHFLKAPLTLVLVSLKQSIGMRLLQLISSQELIFKESQWVMRP